MFTKKQDNKCIFAYVLLSQSKFLSSAIIEALALFTIFMRSVFASNAFLRYSASVAASPLWSMERSLVTSGYGRR